MRQLQSNLARNCPGDVTLEFQDITEVAVVAFRPDMCLVTCLNQLSSDANTRSLPAHATFEQVTHTQFMGDLGSAFVASSVLHRGCSRDNAEMLGVEAT